MPGVATVHVVGAGVSGLACAVHLARSGRRIIVHEASGHAGGRCRSFHDRILDRLIDNGNHILLAGNHAVNDYLRLIGGEDGLTTVEPASFPFVDLTNGERWSLRPGRSRIPWWLLSSRRRPPGTRLLDFLAAARLARASDTATVADALRCSPTALRNFWEPLAVAVLNTPIETGAARLLWLVLRETFLRGEAACRPRIAVSGLSAAFVDPALGYLARHGHEIRFGEPVREIGFSEDRASTLMVDGGPIPIAAGDAVILAVPPRSASRLLPSQRFPLESRAIVNGHFRLGCRFDETRILGVIGGLSQWIFVRGDVASVTISAADEAANLPSDVLAERMWPEVRQALKLAESPVPLHRIIKEKTATLDQSPPNVQKRPKVRTSWRNLFLAGDWTATGLPATIEGSLRSGFDAAGYTMRIVDGG